MPSCPVEPAVLNRVDQVVILAGDVRATRFNSAIGCNRLELPVSGPKTVLGCWGDATARLAFENEPLPVRIQVDDESNLQATRSPSCFLIDRDRQDFRGTAGQLKDLAQGIDPSQQWLVATGAQLLAEPLDHLVQEMVEADGDVVIYSHRDGTPGGLTLLRVGVLSEISDKGFVDFKEQALPQIAKAHSVRVIHRDRPTAWPIRTLSEYIHALREYTLQQKNPGLHTHPFAEQLDSAFSIVADGAQVDPSARLHDSIVMPGAQVGPGAILIRSLVGGGASVGAGQRLVDRLVPAMDGRAA